MLKWNSILNKTPIEIKDLITLAKKIGFAISPSQANEALYCAKEDKNKFKNVFTEGEMKKLVKWFYDNKPILRKSNINYMKTDRKFYNNSVNVRPSINMIKADDLDYRPDKVMLPKVHNVFTPNPSKSSFLDKGTIDEGTLRSKIRVIILILYFY